MDGIGNSLRCFGIQCGLSLCLIITVGCTHRISIHGDGRIESQSAERDCSSESQPCSFVIGKAYYEVYQPIPAEGFSFSHWTSCLSREGSSCRFSIPTELNRAHWGETYSSSVTFLPTFRRIVNSAIEEFDSDSDSPSISENGRYLVFSSIAENVISGTRDINGVFDVYLFDAYTGNLRLLSHAREGEESNGSSRSPVISNNGKFVVWHSSASNLVEEDMNGTIDVFLYSVSSDEISRISVAADGSEGNGASQKPVISADGMIVAFESEADNLVLGDVNLSKDIFVHDLRSGFIERISVDDAGEAGVGRGSFSSNATISAEGNWVAFDSFARLSPDDRNNNSDIYLRDRSQATTRRVSVGVSNDDSNGASTSPSCDRGCRLIAFDSTSSNLVTNDSNGIRDVFVRNVETGTTSLQSFSADGDGANGQSLQPVISSNGAVVAFESLASNLIAEDSNNRRDVFMVHLGQFEEIKRINEGVAALGANADSVSIALDEDGGVIAFSSFATNLSENDSNGSSDVYLRLVD